ncbi:SF0329 family protein [Priestia koreensis]|uniref:SF0329 family protein n=2 Tax=Priestia koreensis TaxID=284581 RepID=UPI00301873F5
MMWSKLRKKIKEFITPELKNRIDIHCTSYRNAHDEADEVWITLDGKKIFGGGFYHRLAAPFPSKSDKEVANSYEFYKESFNRQIKSNKIEELLKLGIHDTYYITSNLWNYIHTPYDEAFASNNPIYKAFSLIDQRLGKRRFDKIQLDENEHPLVILFYNVRKPYFQKS